jgi:hypothetical protein
MKVNSANLAPSDASDKHQLLENLRQQIQTVTSAGRASDGTTFSSGCQAIDRLLPGGGYSRGIVTQWFNPPSHHRNHLASGYAAELLSLMAARQACCDGQAMVVIDPDHAFNPPAAAALGVELSSLIVLRPDIPNHQHKSSDLMWAIDQSLRCSAVGAVWGMVGDADPRWLRRFQLSAEQSGVVGCFVRPGRSANQPSWSEVDWQIKRIGPPQRQSSTATQNGTGQNAARRDSYRRVQLNLLRATGGRAGQDITIQINTITGSVQEARVDHATSSLHLATQLAHPAPGSRAATA